MKKPMSLSMLRSEADRRGDGLNREYSISHLTKGNLSVPKVDSFFSVDVGNVDKSIHVLRQQRQAKKFEDEGLDKPLSSASWHGKGFESSALKLASSGKDTEKGSRKQWKDEVVVIESPPPSPEQPSKKVSRRSRRSMREEAMEQTSWHGQRTEAMRMASWHGPTQETAKSISSKQTVKSAPTSQKRRSQRLYGHGTEEDSMYGGSIKTSRSGKSDYLTQSWHGDGPFGDIRKPYSSRLRRTRSGCSTRYEQGKSSNLALSDHFCHEGKVFTEVDKTSDLLSRNCFSLHSNMSCWDSSDDDASFGEADEFSVNPFPKGDENKDKSKSLEKGSSKRRSRSKDRRSRESSRSKSRDSTRQKRSSSKDVSSSTKRRSRRSSCPPPTRNQADPDGKCLDEPYNEESNNAKAGDKTREPTRSKSFSTSTSGGEPKRRLKRSVTDPDTLLIAEQATIKSVVGSKDSSTTSLIVSSAQTKTRSRSKSRSKSTERSSKRRLKSTSRSPDSSRGLEGTSDQQDASDVTHAKVDSNDRGKSGRSRSRTRSRSKDRKSKRDLTESRRCKSERTVNNSNQRDASENDITETYDRSSSKGIGKDSNSGLSNRQTSKSFSQLNCGKTEHVDGDTNKLRSILKGRRPKSMKEVSGERKKVTPVPVDDNSVFGASSILHFEDVDNWKTKLVKKPMLDSERALQETKASENRTAARQRTAASFIMKAGRSKSREPGDPSARKPSSQKLEVASKLKVVPPVKKPKSEAIRPARKEVISDDSNKKLSSGKGSRWKALKKANSFIRHNKKNKSEVMNAQIEPCKSTPGQPSAHNLKSEPEPSNQPKSRKIKFIPKSQMEEITRKRRQQEASKKGLGGHDAEKSGSRWKALRKANNFIQVTKRKIKRSPSEGKTATTADECQPSQENREHEESSESVDDKPFVLKLPPMVADSISPLSVATKIKVAKQSRRDLRGAPKL